MSSKIADYLTKQVIIDKNVVTFRSLSRHFNVHVNVAKNELFAFHASMRSSEEPAYATYLLSGDASPEPALKVQGNRASGDSMDIDDDGLGGDLEDDMEDDVEEGDVVPQIRITLVGERELEAAKSAYIRIHSEHIYCLSPSPVVDADLICGPTQQIRKADEKLSADASALLGRIIGPHVRRGRYVKPVASSSKVNESPTTKQSVRAESQKAKNDTKEKRKAEPASETKKEEKPANSTKPKPTGKLDWSKAKPKGKVETSNTKEKAKTDSKGKEKAEEPAQMNVDEKDTKAKKVALPSGGDKKSSNGITSSIKVKDDKPRKPVKQPTPPKEASTSDPDIKRGKKRKSALPTGTDSEDEAPKSRTKTPTPSLPVQSKPQAGAKLNGKRNVILSDDEDEDVIPAPRARKRKAQSAAIEMESETEMSVRAMMDIDDDHVIKASSRFEKQQEETSEPESEPGLTTPMEDLVMVDDSDDEPVKPKPRKRKEKKVCPVGQNGLKKRRVVKSRMTFDDKGYMVTEDYSEYESVEEEETEVEEPKAKAKAKKSTVKSKKSTTPIEDRKPLRVSDSLKDDATRKTKSNTNEKPKRSGSSSGAKNAQGNLNSFFGKK